MSTCLRLPQKASRWYPGPAAQAASPGPALQCGWWLSNTGGLCGAQGSAAPWAPPQVVLQPSAPGETPSREQLFLHPDGRGWISRKFCQCGTQATALILEVTAVPSPACLGLSLESREAHVLGCSVSAQGKWLLFLWAVPVVLRVL